MKLSDARDLYYTYSGKTSDLVRQLGLCGIAIIWIFKFESSGITKIPRELILPLWLIVLGLAADLLQYAVAASIYGIYQRRKELAGISEENEFKVPRYFNWPAIFFFVLKSITIVFAYLLILFFVSLKIS